MTRSIDINNSSPVSGIPDPPVLEFDKLLTVINRLNGSQAQTFANEGIGIVALSTNGASLLSELNTNGLSGYQFMAEDTLTSAIVATSESCALFTNLYLNNASDGCIYLDLRKLPNLNACTLDALGDTQIVIPGLADNTGLQKCTGFYATNCNIALILTNKPELTTVQLDSYESGVLTIANCPKLATLTIGTYGTAITTFDISTLTALTQLYLSNAGIGTLTGLAACVNLTTIDANYTACFGTAVDLSTNVALAAVGVQGNDLTAITLGTALRPTLTDFTAANNDLDNAAVDALLIELNDAEVTSCTITLAGQVVGTYDPSVEAQAAIDALVLRGCTVSLDPPS